MMTWQAERHVTIRSYKSRVKKTCAAVQDRPECYVGRSDCSQASASGVSLK